MQAERRVVTRCIEDVEFEIGQEGANKLMGKEELKFVMADVDHVALEAAEIVALKAALAGREDTAAEFGDEGLGPQATAQVAGDNDRSAGVFDDASFAGDFAVSEVAAVLLDRGFAELGVVGVDDLVERLEVARENIRGSGEVFGGGGWVAESCESDGGLVGGGAIDAAREFVVGGFEDVDCAVGERAVFFEFTLTVAATGDLHDGIEGAKGAPDFGEIDVHAGLDHLGGDDAAGLAETEIFLDARDEVEAMLGAHRGGEVNGGFVGGEVWTVECAEVLGELVPEFAGVAGEVDHAEHLRGGSETGGERGPVGGFTGNREAIGDAAKGAEKFVGGRGDFAEFGGEKTVRKSGAAAKSGLSGGAENKTGAVVCGEFSQDVEGRREQVGGQGLDLVENDDGTRDAMEFTAPGGAGGEERFEKLDGGRDDDRRVPVFGDEFEA